VTSISYADTPFQVRADIVAAHGRAWERLARAGTWWTGRERVAIAAEARDAWACRLCRERNDSVSPSAAEGTHEQGDVLTAPVVDAVHRIATDPGRLTERWYHDVLDAGVADAAFVELVGVVANVVAIDTFARAVGAPEPELPAALPGDPPRLRPAAARVQGHWVPSIAEADATGALADLYGGASLVPNIRRALSLVPAETRAFTDLGETMYLPLEKLMDLEYARAIGRPQIELIAARVSALNQCFY